MKSETVEIKADVTEFPTMSAYISAVNRRIRNVLNLYRPLITVNGNAYWRQVELVGQRVDKVIYRIIYLPCSVSDDGHIATDIG